LPDARLEAAVQRVSLQPNDLQLASGGGSAARARLRGLAPEEEEEDDETAEEEIEDTPRAASRRLNLAMSEALRHQDFPTCASVGNQLAELRGVRWLESSDAENALSPIATVDKPNRAVLAAVCGAKAAEVQRSHAEREYFRMVGAMFAASLGPQGVCSKATVAAARDAQSMSVWKACGGRKTAAGPGVRFAEQGENRRLSTSF